MKDDTYAFVVRIWHDVRDQCEEPVSWRGSIERVGESKRLYFCDMDGMVFFIQNQIGINHEPHHTWWQTGLNWFKHGFNRLPKKPLF